MSIDSIVKISIDSQSLAMSQKSFGSLLILGEFDHPDEWLVRTFSSLGELLEWKSRLSKTPKESPTDDEKKELEINEEELIKERQKELENTAVYQAAKAIFSQNPRIDKIKIGRIKKNEDAVSAFTNVCLQDNDFYGILFPALDYNDKYLKNAQALSDIISTERMILGLDIDDKVNSLAEDLKNKKNDRVFLIYSPNNEHLAAAWMGKLLQEKPGEATWAYNELKGVKPYGLTPQKVDELEKVNINRYIGIKGIGVTLDGKMASGRFIDMTMSIDWLHVRIQERLFRLLMINKKIPYKVKGIDLVRSEILAQLKEAIYQGVLAEDPEPMVSVPTPEEAGENSRKERVLRKVSFSGRLAGAIHKIEIQGVVTV